MRLSPRTIDVLRSFFPPNTPWSDIDLELVNMSMGPASLGLPYTLRSRRPIAVTARTPITRALKAIGLAIGNHIILDKKHADFSTASGLALLAHEIEHVIQFEVTPDYLHKYEEAFRQTPPDRPWENPYERAAYARERQVYCELVAAGVPKGHWTPLGVMLWGC